MEIKILLMLMLTHQCMGLLPHQQRQMPQPDLSALRDDVGTLPESDDYMPAAMQALHYFTEMMQYEQIQNPVTTRRPTVATTQTTRRTTPITTTRRITPRPTTAATTTRQTTTTRRIITTTTTRPPVTTTTQAVHSPHKPGVYAPEKPPYYIYFEIPIKPDQAYHKPGIQQPLPYDVNSISAPDWKDPTFVSWFFQPKPPRVVDQFDEKDLQYLDNLPKRLLLDILNEPQNLPAIRDLDNVNEFRKKYDDSYYRYRKNGAPNEQSLRMSMRIQMQQQRAIMTGKKKAPPTRPYVLMVMLYDQLKREAKARKLHQFGGFTPDLLQELYRTSQTNGVLQMKYILESMLSNNEVADQSTVKRVKDILTDLNNTKSDAYKALMSIPPLPFLP